MKSAAFLSVFMMLVSTVSWADQAFLAEGTIKRVEMYGGMSIYALTGDDGNRYVLNRASAEKAGKQCPSGVYQLVGDNPLKPSSYQILKVVRCYK